jgi:N6-L-threonylcarbamoyladenine synthase
MNQKKDLCAGFQEAVMEVIVTKTLAAAKTLGLSKIVVGGGVAANSRLRSLFNEKTRGTSTSIFIAPPALCTDNAAMIAASAYFKIHYGPRKIRNQLKIQPQLHIANFPKKVPPFRP